MKSMKLYAEVHRIHRELEAAGISDDRPLRVEQLTPFDQYHYFGTDAVDEAISALGLNEGSRVLDVGSGLGGPARYIAARTGARVVALELQEDLHEVAAELTARCGLAALVEHRCGNVLDGVEPQEYDAIISFLCFLHIPDRKGLLSACRSALKTGGSMYVEDFGKLRKQTAAEEEALRVKVQCPYLPTHEDYGEQLRAAGFSQTSMHDVSESWKQFTSERLALFRANRKRNVAIHGHDLVDGLDDFYATVAGLFGVGAISGLKITAR
jgi:cyclopropane fatty-acyl-phospholipid synthase-like methyltransferase